MQAILERKGKNSLFIQPKNFFQDIKVMQVKIRPFLLHTFGHLIILIVKIVVICTTNVICILTISLILMSLSYIYGVQTVLERVICIVIRYCANSILIVLLIYLFCFFFLSKLCFRYWWMHNWSWSVRAAQPLCEHSWFLSLPWQKEN